MKRRVRSAGSLPAFLFASGVAAVQRQNSAIASLERETQAPKNHISNRSQE
jgi:hypothetical protein